MVIILHVLCNPAIPFLSIYPKEILALMLQETFSKMLIMELLIKFIPLLQKELRCPFTREWENVVYSHDRILNGNENEWVQLWAITWINTSCRMLKEKKSRSSEAMCGVIKFKNSQQLNSVLIKKNNKQNSGHK